MPSACWRTATRGTAPWAGSWNPCGARPCARRSTRPYWSGRACSGCRRWRPACHTRASCCGAWRARRWAPAPLPTCRRCSAADRRPAPPADPPAPPPRRRTDTTTTTSPLTPSPRTGTRPTRRGSPRPRWALAFGILFRIRIPRDLSRSGRSLRSALERRVCLDRRPARRSRRIRPASLPRRLPTPPTRARPLAASPPLRRRDRFTPTPPCRPTDVRSSPTPCRARRSRTEPRFRRYPTRPLPIILTVRLPPTSIPLPTASRPTLTRRLPHGRSALSRPYPRRHSAPTTPYPGCLTLATPPRLSPLAPAPRSSPSDPTRTLVLLLGLSPPRCILLRRILARSYTALRREVCAILRVSLPSRRTLAIRPAPPPSRRAPPDSLPTPEVYRSIYTLSTANEGTPRL